MVRKRRRVFWLGLVSIVVITGIIAIVVSQSKQSNSNRTDLYGNYFECIVFETAGTSRNGNFTKDRLFCDSSNSMFFNTSMVQITGNTSEFFAGRDFFRNEIKLRFPMSIINERQEIDVDFSKNSIEFVKTYSVRKLSDLSNGVKEVLVVRVNGLDGKMDWSRSYTAFAYFRSQFGVSAHFSRCSDKNLSLVPKGDGNGVIDVKIDENICGLSFHWVSSLADHLIPQKLKRRNPYISYVLPNCVDFIIPDTHAIGFILGDKSWIRSNISRYPAFGIHEFGHNMGFHNSGVDGMSSSQADGSCYMGGDGAKWEDFKASRMCFNAHKTWLTGWFSKYHREINPNNKAFSGKLVGINDIISKDANKADISVLRIKGGSLDLYLMYNRKEGINEEVAQYGDEVVIVGAESSKHMSYVQGSIGSKKKTFSKPNWVKDKTLVIQLCQFTDEKPVRAKIIAYVKGRTSAQCGSNGSPLNPTRNPTRKPTRRPTRRPTQKRL